MSDEIMIRCCAPTLAAIKTGSLFNCPFSSCGEKTVSLRTINDWVDRLCGTMQVYRAALGMEGFCDGQYIR